MNRHDRYLESISLAYPARPARLVFPAATFRAVRACRKLTNRLVWTDLLAGRATFNEVLNRATLATIHRFGVESAEFLRCEAWTMHSPLKPQYEVSFS
jgi:hypothetical protein